MSGFEDRVLRLDFATHKVVDVLLPWFVNGTLESEERALVERHLVDCKRCRREVEWLRELHEACAVVAAPGGSPAVNQLHQRLMEPPSALQMMAARRQRAQTWSGAVIAAQLAAILVLGALVVSSDESRAPYRTLSAAASSASIVVVFDPATTESDFRRSLRAAGARIVDGPTQANAYLLDAPADTREHAIRTLKADRRVVLVESLR
jgi:anti-sigma-K factor RskA